MLFSRRKVCESFLVNWSKKIIIGITQFIWSALSFYFIIAAIDYNTLGGKFATFLLKILLIVLLGEGAETLSSLLALTQVFRVSQITIILNK